MEAIIHTAPYRDQESKVWDERVKRAPMATFLHTRRFLAYHGNRFTDASAWLRDEKDRVVGWFPAAVDPIEAKRVVSHPGATFGGLLHEGELRGEVMVKAMEALVRHYRGKGFRALRYKAVPIIYHQVPSSDDVYALFRIGAVRYRCDLSSTVDLACRAAPSGRRQRGVKKAKQRGIRTVSGPRWAAPLWEVLEGNLAEKHRVKPVHTLEEILRLHEWFPDVIQFKAACLGDRVVAGTVLFVGPRVVHAQYIASNKAGREASALDALFEECLTEAAARGARYFNFGISTEEDGRKLNDGLYQFKSEFGGGGTIHECYEITF